MTREEKIERIVNHEVSQCVARGKTIMLHNTSELIWQELTNESEDYVDNLYYEYFEDE